MNVKEILYYYALQLEMNGIRMDADGDENENLNQPRKTRGHANTRLPYGLCQAAGIDVPAGATPRDAWDLLEKETGISAKDVYRRVKEEKSVKSLKEKIKAGVGKFKGKVEKFTTEHMYKGLMSSPAGKKIAKSVMGIYNDTESSDPYERELMGRIGELFDASGEDFPIRVGTRSTEAHLASYTVPKTGRIVEMTMPSITDAKQARVNSATFTHEMAHAIDNALLDIGEPSWDDKELMSAIDNARSRIKVELPGVTGIGSKVMDAFKDFRAKYLEIGERHRKENKDKEIELNKKYYGDERGWMAGHYWDFRSDVHRAREKEMKQFISKKKIERDWEKRTALGDDGMSTLQGLYDSITGGYLRRNGHCAYGHSVDYFATDRKNAATEIFAEYMALAMCYPKEYKMFKEDQPELCAALEKHTKGVYEKWLSGKAS